MRAELLDHCVELIFSLKQPCRPHSARGLTSCHQQGQIESLVRNRSMRHGRAAYPGSFLPATVSTSNSPGAGSDAPGVEMRDLSCVTRFQLARQQGFGGRA